VRRARTQETGGRRIALAMPERVTAGYFDG